MKTGEKLAPEPLCLPQIPCGLLYNLSQATTSEKPATNHLICGGCMFKPTFCYHDSLWFKWSNRCGEHIFCFYMWLSFFCYLKTINHLASEFWFWGLADQWIDVFVYFITELHNQILLLIRVTLQIPFQGCISSHTTVTAFAQSASWILVCVMSRIDHRIQACELYVTVVSCKTKLSRNKSKNEIFDPLEELVLYGLLASIVLVCSTTMYYPSFFIIRDWGL